MHSHWRYSLLRPTNHAAHRIDEASHDKDTSNRTWLWGRIDVGAIGAPYGQGDVHPPLPTDRNVFRSWWSTGFGLGFPSR